MPQNDDMAHAAHHEAEQEGGDQQWMLTFADLLSLLLTFFVMLYAMSTLDTEPWEKIVHSLSQQLNPVRKVTDAALSADKAITKRDRHHAIDIPYLYALIQEKMKHSPLFEELFSFQQLDNRVVISLVGAETFDESNRLTPEAVEAISLIGDVVRNIKNHIDVYGNATTGEYTQTKAFPSKWELSLSRALVVSQLLRKRGYEYRITAYGRTDASYKDLMHIAKEQRDQVARRVDIVIRSHQAE